MLSEEMANAYLTARIVEIKDIVLSELQDLSVEDVKQAESREALRQRLISAISQILPTKPEWADPEPIKKVLFEEFVLQ
jgi:flagellar basal body-associated protein FliL